MNNIHFISILFLFSFVACQDAEKKSEAVASSSPETQVTNTNSQRKPAVEKRIVSEQSQRSKSKTDSLLKAVETLNKEKDANSLKEEKETPPPPKKAKYSKKKTPEKKNNKVQEKESVEKFEKILTPEENETEASKNDLSNSEENEPIKAGSDTHPDIQFSSLVYDFGEINEGDKIDYKFNFVNTGRRPLEVIRATAPCGCTVPSYPFIAIGPGETGYIGVQYNSIGKDGHQKPAIDVFTSLRKAPFRLHLEGHVIMKDKDKPEVLSNSPFEKDSIKGN